MSEVAALLAERIAELAPELVGDKPTTRGRTEWRWGSKGSLGVHVAGPKRGRFYDNEAAVYGDALALVTHLRRTSMADAWRWSLAWLSLEGRREPREAPSRPEPSQRPPETDAAKVEMAGRLWREAVPAIGSPVQRYLAGRGLELPPADLFSDDPADHRNTYPLRFHPACPRGAERLPAMLGLMTDPDTGEARGVHRTFLRPDGSGKAPGQAKMMLGPAGVVRLVPDAEVTHSLGAAEGVETGLAVMQGFGWVPVWAATSAGMVRNFPVLAGIEALSIFADADRAGREAAEACGARWIEAGREVVVVAAPTGDFNDTIRERAA